MRTTVVHPMPSIALSCVFGRDCIKVADKNGVDDWPCLAGCAFVVDDTDELVMLVRCIDSEADIMSTIAHESYHLTQRYFDQIGDEEPSEETTSHVLDAIVYEAVKQYRKWRKKHPKG